jgi:hypothetical protein
LISAIVSILTGGLVDKVVDLGKAYFNKQISQAEFESKVKIAAGDAAAQVEKSWAEAASSIAASTQDALKASPILQRGYVIVLFMQLFVLVWYQIGTSLFLLITGVSFPPPMVPIEWAYLLISAMIGAGPFVFKR